MSYFTNVHAMGTGQCKPENSVFNEKSVFIGTHRICTPEETLARIQPFLPQIGITRVADITQLDELGIPIFQAIRPGSRNISVSQGKGITKALAKVSAIMESIEGWHAEQPALISTRATLGEMAAQLPYTLAQLSVHQHHILHDALELEWFPATILSNADTPAQSTYVPADIVRLDFTVKNMWHPPTFSARSNGLASGNSFEEAVLHALYEIIERDTFERVRKGLIHQFLVDLDTIDGVASRYLIEKLKAARATIRIFYASGATGIACFKAMISSPSYPIVTGGGGCHIDRDVALSRALTEAAQTRLTMIAGSRDDIQSFSYKRLQGWSSFSSFTHSQEQPQRIFQEIPSSITPSSSIKEDLHNVLQRIISAFGTAPLIVDLTHQSFNIPVIFAILPQALFWEDLS
jgi:ribosomal protein S12 methylthiotransferase accessory factor